MFKYALVFITLFSFSAYAAREMHDETIDVEIPAHIVETRSNIYLPDCNDEYMLREVMNKIKEYHDSNPVKGIINKRKRVLMLKNLKGFTEIPINEFDYKTSHNVASEIVMTKINYQIKENEMRLCIDNNKIMYLLVYPEEDGGFRVQIINFIARGSDGNKFSVLYVPQYIPEAD